MTDSPAGPWTLAAPARHALDPIKGSRFLACAAPVGSEQAADAFVDEVATEFPDATHHCWAWRLDADAFRASDAGEPSGSAGRPILASIEGRDLMGVVVVVVRWYGGTNLGIGGLVRAYGRAAGAVLDRAERVPWQATTPVVVRFAYPDQGAVDAVLHAFDLEPVEAAYTADVRLVVEVPDAGREEFEAALAERTGGRAAVEARSSATPR